MEISAAHPQVLWIETNTCVTRSYVLSLLVLSHGLCDGLTLVGCQTSTQPLSPTQLFSHYPFLNSTGGENKIKKLMGQDKDRSMSGAGEWGMGHGACGQSITVCLCCSFLLLNLGSSVTAPKMQ